MLTPLNHLIKKGERWKWTPQCHQAINSAKKALSSAPVLAHYDSQLLIQLTGDALAYGIGANNITYLP